VVEKLAKQDEAVLVKELAKEILPGLGSAIKPGAKVEPANQTRSTGVDNGIGSEGHAFEATNGRKPSAEVGTGSIRHSEDKGRSGAGSSRTNTITRNAIGSSKSMGPPLVPSQDRGSGRTPLPERRSHSSHSHRSTGSISGSSGTALPSSAKGSLMLCLNKSPMKLRPHLLLALQPRTDRRQGTRLWSDPLQSRSHPLLLDL
jgi:hypothetical protein